MLIICWLLPELFWLILICLLIWYLSILCVNKDKRSHSKAKHIECTVCIETNKKAREIIKKLINQNYINEFNRCNSFSPIKKKNDISENEIEKMKFAEWIKFNKEIDQKIGEQILTF